MNSKQVEISEELYATSWQRLANFIIDYLMQLFLAVVVGMAAVFIDLLTGTTLAFKVQNMNKIQEYLLGFIILAIYYFFFEVFTSRTVGKFITGTIVVTEFGEKPSVRAILIRTCCRLIPFEFLTFFNNSPGWHDTISHTFVVRKKLFLAHQKSVQEFDEIGQESEVL